MRRFLPCFCLVSAFALSAPVLAIPITFTQTSMASGSIGSTSFSNATVTITQVTDTSFTAFNSVLGTYDNGAGVRTVTISGVGTASFLSGTIGFSDAPFSSQLAFHDPVQGFSYAGLNSAYASYSLSGPLGPVSGTLASGLSFEDFTNTSLGALYFTASGGPTFQAALTPAAAPEIDPSTAGSGLALVLGGIAVLRGRWVRPRRIGVSAS